MNRERDRERKRRNERRDGEGKTPMVWSFIMDEDDEIDNARYEIRKGNGVFHKDIRLVRDWMDES